jgi:hypothetical protein
MATTTQIPKRFNAVNAEMLFDDVEIKVLNSTATPEEEDYYKAYLDADAKGEVATSTVLSSNYDSVRERLIQEEDKEFLIPPPRETALHKFVRIYPYFNKKATKEGSKASAHKNIPPRIWSVQYLRPIVKRFDKAVNDHDFIDPILALREDLNHVSEQLSLRNISPDNARAQALRILKPLEGSSPRTPLQENCASIARHLTHLKRVVSKQESVNDDEGRAGIRHAQKTAVLLDLETNIELLTKLSDGSFYQEFETSLHGSDNKLAHRITSEFAGVAKIASETKMHNTDYKNIGFKFRSLALAPFEMGFPLFPNFVNDWLADNVNKRKLKEFSYEEVTAQENKYKVGYVNPLKRTAKVVGAQDLGNVPNAERFVLIVEGYYRSKKNEDGSVDYDKNVHTADVARQLINAYKAGDDVQAVDAVQRLSMQLGRKKASSVLPPGLADTMLKDSYASEGGEHYEYFVRQIETIAESDSKHSPEWGGQRHMSKLYADLTSTLWAGLQYPGKGIFATPAAEDWWRSRWQKYNYRIQAHFSGGHVKVIEKDDSTELRVITPKGFWWAQRDEDGNVIKDETKKEKRGLLGKVKAVYTDAPVWFKAPVNWAWTPGKVFIDYPMRPLSFVARQIRKNPDIPGWPAPIINKLLNPKILVPSLKAALLSATILAAGSLAEEGIEKGLKHAGVTNQSILGPVLHTDSDGNLKTFGQHIDGASRINGYLINYADFMTALPRLGATTLMTGLNAVTGADSVFNPDYVDYLDPGNLHNFNQSVLGDRGKADGIVSNTFNSVGESVVDPVLDFFIDPEDGSSTQTAKNTPSGGSNAVTPDAGTTPAGTPDAKPTPPETAAGGSPDPEPDDTKSAAEKLKELQDKVGEMGDDFEGSKLHKDGKDIVDGVKEGFGRFVDNARLDDMYYQGKRAAGDALEVTTETAGDIKEGDNKVTKFAFASIFAALAGATAKWGVKRATFTNAAKGRDGFVRKSLRYVTGVTVALGVFGYMNGWFDGVATAATSKLDIDGPKAAEHVEKAMASQQRFSAQGNGSHAPKVLEMAAVNTQSHDGGAVSFLKSNNDNIIVFAAQDGKGLHVPGKNIECAFNVTTASNNGMTLQVREKRKEMIDIRNQHPSLDLDSLA